MEPKVLVYEMPDGRKLYLCADDEAKDYVVTMEVDGQPTGFRVPLHIMRIQMPGIPSLDVDWEKALDVVQYIQVFGELPSPSPSCETLRADYVATGGG